MKRDSVLALLGVLLLSTGAALAAPVTLYRIELEPGANAYRFAAQNGLPVYHLGQSLLLAGAPADAARHREVASQTLVYRGEAGGIRWLHRRRGGPAIESSLRTIFRDADLALVAAGDVPGHLPMGLAATEFPAQPIPLFPQANLINPGLAYDPAIDALAQQITIEHFQANVETLQAFNTRNSGANTNHLPAEWLRQKYMSFGIADVAIDSFIDPGFSGSIKIRNVIATIPGTADTHTVYIVGGHFDSCVWPFNPSFPWAPGADDNGSGSSAVLEMARVLAANPPDATVKFISFDCEEWGLYGSKKDANDHLAAGTNVGCMLNYDMIGSIGNDSVFVSKVYPGSEAYAQVLGQSAGWYGRTADTSLVPEYNSVYLNGSDSWRYHSNGFRATYAEEYVFSPVYHQTNDSTTYMNMRYGASIARAGLGMIATLASYPQPVAGLEAQDVGDGSSLFAAWQANAAPNVTGYRLKWGRASGAYTDSATLSGTSDTISGLMADSIYYVAVAALNAWGRQSPIISEVSMTPRTVPLAPAGLAAEPAAGGITLTWSGNRELDLAGYRLYRAIDDTSSFDSLNASLLADTAYADTPLSGASKYYYKVRAFDLDGNPGAFSERAYGRPATLDQGVLVIDETKNWTTNPWPRDTAQDSFYDYVLDGITHQQHDMGTAAQRPLLADLAPFSTILWHGDDYTELMASGSAADLRRYLDLGGNLWITGWKIAGSLHGNASYPFVPADTSFLKAFLRVDTVDLSGNSDSFLLADGLLGYTDLEVDSLKGMAQYWNNYMLWIETYSPAAGGETIFTMGMKDGSGPYQGRPCGVRFLGSSYKTVVMGFPLIFMERDQARLAAQRVMADFGETGVEGGPSATLGARRLRLESCAPNPFSGSTNISYQLPRAGRVGLSIYNVAGQRVRTLVDAERGPGPHQVRWDGRDDRGAAAAGGVYLARLSLEGDGRTVKLTLIR